MKHRNSPRRVRRTAPARTGDVRSTPVPGTPLDAVEIEWQFEAAGFEPVEAWIRAFPDSEGLCIGAPHTVRQRDVYFDTRDWKLFRADYAFRIRRKPGRVQATLKALRTPPSAVKGEPGDAGLAIRREITQAAQAERPAGVFAVPGPVEARLRLLTTASALRPVADLSTTRRRFPITLGGRAAGEIALDRTLLHGRSGTRRMLRIEVEVARAVLGELRPFVERFRLDLGIAPAGRSKLEWALDAEGFTPGVRAGVGSTLVLPTMTLGEVAYAALRKHFTAVLQHEPGTRLGDDPEHLHDMRVATRRMRAALRVFSDTVPKRDLERLRRELRALGQVLGAVRDLDVQLEQIRDWKTALITVEPQALDPFLELLEELRQRARGRLLAFLDSPRYRRLIATARTSLRRGPVRRPIARQTVRDAGPALVRRARKRVLRQIDSLGAESPPGEYHRLRILAKRWRYTMEFLEPVYGDAAAPLIEALSALQDALGLYQDAHVLMAELPALARREARRLPDPTRYAVGEVAQLYAAQAARQRALCPAAVRRVRGKRWKTLAAAMETAAPASPATSVPGSPAPRRRPSTRRRPSARRRPSGRRRAG